MLMTPTLLIDASEQAGIKVPKDVYDFPVVDFPHFDVFCKLQLNRPCTLGEHWDNAKVIAQFSEEEIKQLTVSQAISAGFAGIDDGCFTSNGEEDRMNTLPCTCSCDERPAISFDTLTFDNTAPKIIATASCKTCSFNVNLLLEAGIEFQDLAPIMMKAWNEKVQGKPLSVITE